MVQRGKEFINEEIWLSVGREENVGDIMEANEFHNRKCHCLK